MTGSADKKPVEWRFETVPMDEDNSRLDRFLRRLVPGLAQGSIERMLEDIAFSVEEIEDSVAYLKRDIKRSK